MNISKSVIKSPVFYSVIIGLYLCLYLTMGFYTTLRHIEISPNPLTWHGDFNIYKRALNDALNGVDPYSLRSIGEGFLYPPPALLITELFSHIRSFFLEVSLYSTLNIALLALMVYGIARHYRLSNDKVWYWYVICFGFAPFLELLQNGQINMITLFGIFMLFIFTETSPVLSGIGLGLAVVTKVSPILFFWYLVIQRRYKVVLATLAAIAIFTVISIVRYGLAPVLEYPDVFRWLINQFVLGNNSQSLVAKLAFIGSSNDLQKFIFTYFKPLQSSLMPVLAFLVSGHQIIQRTLTIYILLILVISGLCTMYGNQPKEPLFIITTFGMMLSPNILWYHHYIFILLPLLIWMGWSRLSWKIIMWCLLGVLIIQFERWLPPYGLLIHIFTHASILLLLFYQLHSLYLSQKLKVRPISAPI